MSAKYSRVINNIIEMLEERGDDATELRADLETNMARYAQEVQGIRLTLYTRDTAIIFHIHNTTLNSFFAGNKDSPMKTPDDIQGLMAQHKERRQFIFVCSDKVTPVTLKNAKDKVKALDKLLFTGAAGAPAGFQLFEEKYLAYNPSKHELVPRHTRLSKEEAKRVKEIYNIKTVNGVSQLPIISNTDIMARWLGLRHGDVVMITRNNPNSGTYYYYRICT